MSPESDGSFRVEFNQSGAATIALSPLGVAYHGRIISASYRLPDYQKRTYDVQKRGIRIRALTELMR
jgi:hypothetical protein